MMKVAAIAMLFGATHAQTPICKLTNDCKCVPSVTVTPGIRPDCVKSITLIAPTAADNGCCDNDFNQICEGVTFACSYDLCAIVEMKEPFGCGSHNWSWNDGGIGGCTNESGDATACTGPTSPACGNISGTELHLYDASNCISANKMWEASWACGTCPH